MQQALNSVIDYHISPYGEVNQSDYRNYLHASKSISRFFYVVGSTSNVCNIYFSVLCTFGGKCKRCVSFQVNKGLRLVRNFPNFSNLSETFQAFISCKNLFVL